MKRSEMIDQIVCDLLTYAATYPQYPLSQLQLAAEKILSTQEELGMRPPFSHDMFMKDYAKHRGPNANGNQWEPEGE